MAPNWKALETDTKWEEKRKRVMVPERNHQQTVLIDISSPCSDWILFGGWPLLTSSWTEISIFTSPLGLSPPQSPCVSSWIHPLFPTPKSYRTYTWLTHFCSLFIYSLTCLLGSFLQLDFKLLKGSNVVKVNGTLMTHRSSRNTGWMILSFLYTLVGKSSYLKAFTKWRQSFLSWTLL